MICDLLSDLGLIDAALGRKEEALSEGRRAMELVPIAQEAMTGGINNEGFAKTSVCDDLCLGGRT